MRFAPNSGMISVYIMNNFDDLMRKDNLSLLNKRLRLCEYIITPFVRKMSNSTYRILNSKTLNINKIKGVLKPNPMVIISDLQKSRLLRYNNSTNDMDLFNVALKWSNRGKTCLLRILIRGNYHKVAITS